MSTATESRATDERDHVDGPAFCFFSGLALQRGRLVLSVKKAQGWHVLG